VDHDPKPQPGRFRVSKLELLLAFLMFAAVFGIYWFVATHI
jgi:hypothetical protein